MTIDWMKLKQKILESETQNRQIEELKRQKRMKQLESGAQLAKELRHWLQSKNLEETEEVSELE